MLPEKVLRDANTKLYGELLDFTLSDKDGVSEIKQLKLTLIHNDIAIIPLDLVSLFSMGMGKQSILV